MFFPDIVLLSDFPRMHEVISFLRPYGYAIFVLVSILIVIGFLLKNRIATLVGSITVYLPIFGYFAFTMFFLAGIGVIRILMLPILDIDPGILELGSIIYLIFINCVYIRSTTQY